MEKYFGNAYRGDPGVPHSGPNAFFSMWIGCAGFSAFHWYNPYPWQDSIDINFHDRAMLFEQYHWKEARKKNQKYEFEWNKRPKSFRDMYYNCWPIYFP